MIRIIRIGMAVFLAASVTVIVAPNTFVSYTQNDYDSLDDALDAAIHNIADRDVPSSVFEIRKPSYSAADYHSDVTFDGYYIDSPKYDPRGDITAPDINSLVLTPVKDQLGDGCCWLFAQIAILEHFVKKTYGTTIQFSEQHPKFALAETTNREYGAVSKAGDGGNPQYIESYYFRPYLNGPVLQSADPYYQSSRDTFNTDSRTESQVADIPQYGRVTGMQLIPTPKNHTEYVSPGEDVLFRQQIKEAVLAYGGAAIYYQSTAIVSNGNAIGYTDHKADGYGITYHSTGNEMNHAVTLVGWDDNIPADMFANTDNTGEPTPKGNGGWLIKNSWGSNSNSTEYGYFWLSYYSHIGRPYSVTGYDETFKGTVLTNAVTGNVTGAPDTQSNTDIYYGDIFENVTGTLTDISFFVAATPDTTVTAEIFAAVGSPTDTNASIIEQAINAGNKSGNGKISIPYNGYATITLDTPIDCSVLDNNCKIAVIVKLTNNSPDNLGTLYVPVEYSGDNDKTATGTSQYSYNGTDFLPLTSDTFVSAILA